MIAQHTKCDNPNCLRTGVPESIKPYVPPYGWLVLVKAWFVGCGPNVKVEVCSVACLTPAVEHVVEEDRRR